MKLFNKVVLCLASLLTAIVPTAASAGTITYYHNDLLGSPVVATNISGQVIWRESYRPYGERLTNSPNSTDNKVWFTSRRQDTETGLVYMGARFYDPALGRFISTDSVGFNEKNIQSFNRYTYANNNPLKYVDSNGKSASLALCWGGPVACTIGLGLTALTVYYGAKAVEGTARALNSHNESADSDDVGTKDPSSGRGVKVDDRIRGQLSDRGWSEQEVQEAANGEPVGSATDDRRGGKTGDGEGRKNEPATVYGSKDGYVVVNDRTREVVQVSDKNPGSGWIPDSRIKWNGER